MSQAQAIPCSPDSERYILGSVMLDGTVMDSIRGTLEMDDFYLKSHATIWQAMTAVYDAGTPIETLTIYTELKQRKEQVTLGQLHDLMDGIPQFPNLSPQCAQLKEKTAMRRLLNLCGAIQARGLSGTERFEDIRGSLEKGLLDLHDTGPKDRRPVSTRELIEEFGVQDLLSPRREQGVRLPWNRLNEALCGFRPGQMIVTAAYTGRGKTSLGLQIATHITRQMKTPVYWTLEMPPKMLFRRAINQITGIDNDRSRQGALTPGEKAREAEAVEWLNIHPIYFDSHSRTVPSFLASLRQVRARTEVGLAVVDYLQLIRFAGRAESRTREVGENSRSLKLAALDLEIPFLVLSQFSRPKNDQPASIHSLKESGDIENDADVILLINSGELNGDAEVPVTVHLGKQREGPAGFDIPMIFNPPSQTFHSE